MEAKPRGNVRPTKRHKITEFFAKETHDEREDHMAHMWDEVRITGDKQKQAAVLEGERKVEKICEGNRLRKQKQHTGERAKRLEEGKKGYVNHQYHSMQNYRIIS